MELKDNCGICLINMTRGEIIRLIPCRHLFHQKCINLVGSSCPLCRAEIEDSERIIRKTYKQYSDTDRHRIIDAANKGLDWVELAASLSVSYKTAHRWATQNQTALLKRGGKKPRSLEEDEINVVLNWLEDRPELTLREIAEKINGHFNKRLTLTTVSNTLHGKMYSIKSVHVQPVSMNSETNKAKRATFVNKINDFVRMGKQVVWIDETNFNLFCRRKHGWSRVGARTVISIPTSRGPNVHLIGAIGTGGIIQMDTRRGSFTAESANNWVRGVLDRWEELGNELSELVLVCDNAPCHSRLDQLFQNSPATLLRMSPYSPMLNPIEIIWSKIKTTVKSRMNVPDVNSPNFGEQRLVYLEDIINVSKSCITPGDCSRAIQHTTTFYQTALQLEDMPVGQ